MLIPLPPAEDDQVRRARDSERRATEQSSSILYGVRETTSGTTRYLEGLTTDVAVGTNFSVSAPNDAVFRWTGSPLPQAELLAHPIATGRALITVGAGEVQINPSGGFVQGLVGYSVKDANGVTVPGGTLATAQRYGRIYADRKMNIGVRTPEVPITIDPVAYPGPYRIEAFFGTWVSAANAGACSFTFNDLSLRVDVISTGVIP